MRLHLPGRDRNTGGVPHPAPARPRAQPGPARARRAAGAAAARLLGPVRQSVPAGRAARGPVADQLRRDRHRAGRARGRRPGRARVRPGRSARQHPAVHAAQPLLPARPRRRPGLVAVRRPGPRLPPGAGHLRLRARPPNLRLRQHHRHLDRGRRVRVRSGRMPRLHPPGHLVLPGPEHPGPVRVRLPAGHGRAARPGADGLRGLDGGVAGRPVVDVRSPQQHRPQGARRDRARPRRLRCGHGHHLRRSGPGADDRDRRRDPGLSGRARTAHYGGMRLLSDFRRFAVRMRLFRVTGVAALAIAALVMAAAPAAAGAPILRHPPRNIDVSQMAGNHAEDAVAINPTDPRNVVAVSVASSLQAGLFEGVTFDGGRTWHRKVIGTGGALGQICCDEALAWDHYGNLWLSYLINENRNAVIAVSTDGGRTFTRVKEIVAAPPGGATQPDADQPHIAVGPHSVWVSYASFATVASLKGFIQASGAPVSGLGRYGAFSWPETVPAPRGQNDYGGVAVGPDGQVTVIWETDIADRCCSDVYTAVDPDGFGPRGFGTLRLLGHSNVGGFFTIPAQPGQGAYTEPQLAQYDGPG